MLAFINIQNWDKEKTYVFLSPNSEGGPAVWQPPQCFSVGANGRVCTELKFLGNKGALLHENNDDSSRLLWGHSEWRSLPRVRDGA